MKKSRKSELRRRDNQTIKEKLKRKRSRVLLTKPKRKRKKSKTRLRLSKLCNNSRTY